MPSINLILKLKRQSRLFTYINSYFETFSAGCTSVKGKIWLPVIYGNSNISNLTGNFRTLIIGVRSRLLLIAHSACNYTCPVLRKLYVVIIKTCYVIRDILLRLFTLAMLLHRQVMSATKM